MQIILSKMIAERCIRVNTSANGFSWRWEGEGGGEEKNIKLFLIYHEFSSIQYLADIKVSLRLS